MYFDDRLATVLRARVTGEAAANTQYRQLLDLAGSLPEDVQGPLVEDGLARLEELAPLIPAARRAALIRDPALRLGNPRLVALLAEDEPSVAAAVIAAARLDDGQWLAVIPSLPLRARGFLRHRRDLGPGPAQLLARLGIGDLVLTGPDIASSPELPEEPGEIGILLRRIEAFRQARAQAVPAGETSPEAPRLPLDGESEVPAAPRPQAFDFATDGGGRIVWANPAVAPRVTGIALAGALADVPTVERMRRFLPVEGGQLVLEGAPAIDGPWRIDAVPSFASPTGRFTGYCGRLRRPAPAPGPARDTENDRIREMLHELRTPVNAIQGFAEIIQQQLFGPSPHEYRSLAASIAADAARLLAGFDELDRLARLETGALELDDGACDLAGLLAAATAQLEPYLKGRGARVWAAREDGPVRVPLAPGDAERLAWRLIATLAEAVSSGEELLLTIDRGANFARFHFPLPASLAGSEDIFVAAAQLRQQAVSAGMFGPGFTLRLARAEARAAGGDLTREGARLVLALPHLTGADPDHSDGSEAASGGSRPV